MYNINVCVYVKYIMYKTLHEYHAIQQSHMQHTRKQNPCSELFSKTPLAQLSNNISNNISIKKANLLKETSFFTYINAPTHKHKNCTPGCE